MGFRVAIAGASGYAGGELARLITAHPELDLVTVTAHSNAGKALGTSHPHLESLGLTLADTTPETLAGHDIVFLALPHGASGAFGDSLDARLVVDCAADHRLTNEQDWADYYGGAYSSQWVYGMPELPTSRAALTDATRIAVPGCNATAVTLGFAPLVHRGLIDTTDLVSVLAVGVSGAGKSLREDLLASEVLGSASAYAVGGTHRHNPEIRQNFGTLGADEVTLSFTPMLVPMSRGILATNTATLHGGVSTAEVRSAIDVFFAENPFVTLLPEGCQPRTADVLGSNATHIQVVVDKRANRVVVTVAIDNLGKGTASAAIQSTNIALGLPETLGLSAIGVAP
jgi:N-acetyl-gamma-glutamyl-phosphate reductase